MRRSAKSTQVFQIVVALFVVVLACGLLVSLFGNDEDPLWGSSESETEKIETETEAEETYIPSEGDVSCDHNMVSSKQIKAATCSTEGSMLYVCSKCGKTQEQAIAKNDNHNYELKQYSDLTHIKYCLLCDEQMYEVHSKKITTVLPTCTTQGSYTYNCACGLVKVDTVEATGHTLGEVTKLDSTQHGAECSVCKKVVSESHTYNVAGTVTIAATCYSVGEETYACTKCSHMRTEPIPMLSHALVTDADKTEAATCTTAEKLVKVCSRDGCNYSKIEIGVAALGHNLQEDISKTVAATCVSAEKKHMVCTRSGCTHSETQVGAAALGHSFVTNEEKSVASTCVAQGIVYKECQREGCNVYDTTALPLADHIYDSVSGTCSMCGHECKHNYVLSHTDSEGCSWYNVYNCTICDRVFEDTGNSWTKHTHYGDHSCACGEEVFDYCVDNDGDNYCDYCDEAVG